MSSEILSVGHNARMQASPVEEVRLRLSVTGAAPLRLLGVLLDEQGHAVGPAPLLTWRTQGREAQIALNQGETISAIMHTAAIQSPIQAMMFIVAPYGREVFAPNERLFVAIASDGAEPMAIEAAAPAAGQKAVALCEFYRHPEQGLKVRALTEWRAKPLTTLLEQLGVSPKLMADQMLYPLPQGRKSDAERASLNDLLRPKADETITTPEIPPSAPPIPEIAQPGFTASPLVQPPVHLATVGAQHRVSAADAMFGPIQIKFSWHQPIATKAQVKLDIGCLWELQNGQKGQLRTELSEFGSTTAEPFIALGNKIRQVGSVCDETFQLNGNAWQQIKRLLCFAMISEGPNQWDPLDGRVQITIPEQPAIAIDCLAPNGSKSPPLAALLLIENRSDQMRISYPGTYFGSYFDLDVAFDFGLQWADRRPIAMGNLDTITWQPRAETGLMGKLFGPDLYAQAENLMRAALACAALVMISDGRVNLDERRHALIKLMETPLGRYFSQYDVRNALEQILVDFKHRRQASEKLARDLLKPWRGDPDAEILIQIMQVIAMADGQVSLPEERAVERIAKFLQRPKAA